MKRHVLLASVLGLALHVGAYSRASAVEPADGNDRTEGHRHPGPGGRPDAIAARLKLTADQKKVFDAAVKERRDKMMALQDEFAAKRKTIVDESDGKISAILTADQKTEFAKMKAEADKRREEFKAQRRGAMDDHREPSDQK